MITATNTTCVFLIPLPRNGYIVVLISSTIRSNYSSDLSTCEVEQCSFLSHDAMVCGLGRMDLGHTPSWLGEHWKPNQSTQTGRVTRLGKYNMAGWYEWWVRVNDMKVLATLNTCCALGLTWPIQTAGTHSKLMWIRRTRLWRLPAVTRTTCSRSLHRGDAFAHPAS